MSSIKYLRTLKLDTLIWSKYGDGYYPAYVREILDPRSPKVKVSFCDQEMADVVMSVNICECLLFQVIGFICIVFFSFENVAEKLFSTFI